MDADTSTSIGDFPGDLSRMVQIRGRIAGEDWQRYERSFSRCP